MNFGRADFFNLTWIAYAVIKEATGIRQREWRLLAISLALVMLSDLLWLVDDIELLVFESDKDL